jgi:hypothetical protein
MQTPTADLDNDVAAVCRCGTSLKSSRGSVRLPPAIARIMCDKCNPKPGDDTNELEIARRRTPEHSPLISPSETPMLSPITSTRTFYRSISGEETIERLPLMRSTSTGDNVRPTIIGLKLSASAESITRPRRLFRALETIQDTA